MSTSAAGLAEPRAPAPGEFDIWLTPVRWRSDCLAAFDAAETEQLSRLTSAAARATFTTSRTAQRLIGARYLGLAPAEVRVVRDCGHCGGQHGRPRYPGAPIDYSVSHTPEWLMVAVTGTGLVGVDLERVTACHDVERSAPVALSAAERERFAQVPEALRARWFATAWTRKEAAMKLVGLGLAAPPGLLEVTGRQVSVGAVPRWPGVPIFLSDLPAPAGHVAALASTLDPTAVRAFALAEARTEGEKNLRSRIIRVDSKSAQI